MPSDAGKIRVLIVTPLGEGGQGGIDRIMDEVRARLRCLPDDDLQISFIASRGQGPIAAAPVETAAVMARLLGALRGLGPDVAHINLSSHGSTLRKLAIAMTARLVGVPYVIHLHGSGFREYWDDAPGLLAKQIRIMFARSARVLVLGRVWRDYVVRKAPEAGSKVLILPNATCPPDAPPARTRQAVNIIFLGEVGPRKGVPELVRALATLPKDGPWRATIAGNGAVEKTRAEIESRGLAGHVTLPGWVGPREVRRLLSAADIVVLPSHEENLPMSVIEGMAYGRAVVATPVGAVEDIITHGKTGLLVPVGDSDALAKALRRLMEDPELRRSIGAAAAEFHRKNLNINVYVDELKSLWREVASERIPKKLTDIYDENAI
jgi:glycosyltransferase involved in cell wall biosynthesis